MLYNPLAEAEAET